MAVISFMIQAPGFFGDTGIKLEVRLKIFLIQVGTTKYYYTTTIKH